MNKRILCAGVLLLASGLAQAEAWYRWVDNSGTIHYGDTPAANAAEVKKYEFSVQPAGDNADLPYEVRRAQQNFPVTLYTVADCGDPCLQARALLNKRGIPFADKILQTKEEFDAFKQLSGSDGVPTLAVGKAWLHGLRAAQWHGELDAAGYPAASPE